MNKKRKNIFVFFFLSLIFIVSFSACTKKKSEKKLIVGMELQFPPFETTDAGGNPVGFSVDLAKALAEDLGRTLEIKNIAWTGLIPAVQTGAVDIVISSMSVTDERKKSIDFSESYGDWFIVSLLNSKVDVSRFEDLNDPKYTAAVKIGTVAETIANEKLPKAKVLKPDTWDAVVLEVAQGRADVAMYDAISVHEAHSKYPDTTKPLYTPIEGWSNPVAAAIKKGNDDFRNKVNAFIKRAKADGTIATIANKYLGEINVELKKQGSPALFE